MKNIIKKLFCLHKWNILKSYPITGVTRVDFVHYKTDYFVDILTCSECGKIKKIIT